MRDDDPQLRMRESAHTCGARVDEHQTNDEAERQCNVTTRRHDRPAAHEHEEGEDKDSEGDDEDEEGEAGKDEHAVHPVGLLERGDEVLRGRHEGGEHVVCCGCGLEGGGGGLWFVNGAVREGRPVKGWCAYLAAVSRGRNAPARPA